MKYGYGKCQARGVSAPLPTLEMPRMTYNVLFLCTGNSARSILAEAILDKLGAGRFQAYSAGSHPKGAVNPYALALLGQKGFDTSRFRSKAWDEFAAPGTPPLDFIITVCDSAAGEVCPIWPGRPVTAHWGMPDPAAVEGTPDDIMAAFVETYGLLNRRIAFFTNLKLAGLDRQALQRQMTEAGKQS